MPHYSISYSNAASRIIQIEVVFQNIHQSETYLQLPAWRPGRYELGNFAQNIVSFKIYNSSKEELSFQKVTKDKWKVDTENVNEITVVYTYYAADLNAGSTFLCDDFIYMNPVNCCIYIEDRIDEPCTLALLVPDNYTTAIGLPALSKNIFTAKNFHELVDSPFISGTTLQHKTYECYGTTFYVWFNGTILVDWNKVLKDFKAFTHAQYEAFSSFPFHEFHFLNHVLPYPAYHGVEHLTCTVISLGPAEKVMGELYEELLGISSHELYHCWNIKTIRPLEMMPYDYTKENYSELGYVAEGVTTYMGDQMLLRSQVFSRDEWKKTFNQQLEKHFQNFARFNMSVAQSSFDTWLDGYKAGAPNRKVSIYTEGCLCAFMADILIRKTTENEKSLDHAMQWLYDNFGLKNKGYAKDDYQKALELTSGLSFENFFVDYYYGTKDYQPLLKECLDYLGYELQVTQRDKNYETDFGIKLLKENHQFVVKAIFPTSEVAQKGIALNDKILKVNGADFNELEQLKGENITITFENHFLQEKNITLQKANYFKKYSIERIHSMTEQQARNYAIWAGVIVK